MKITKSNLVAFRADFNAAVKALEEKHGVKIAAGNIRYSDTDFRFTTTVSNTDASGAVHDQAAADFKRYCTSYGVTADMLGKTFTSGRNTYTLSGLKPRNRKFPFLAKRADGRTFKFTEEAIERAFA